MPIDRSKYVLEVIEGTEGTTGRLTEIRMNRIDGEPITKEEQEALKSELSKCLPSTEYRLTARTTPAENNESLHVYVSLQRSERFRRTGHEFERVLISGEEVTQKLQNQWNLI